MVMAQNEQGLQHRAPQTHGSSFTPTVEARFLPRLFTALVNSNQEKRPLETDGVRSAPSMEHGTAHHSDRLCRVLPSGIVDGQSSRKSTSMDPISGLESDRSRLVSDLYKSCYHRVFGFVSRKVGADDAEEIAHEVFIRLLRVRNLETMTVSVAYLLRIAENLIRRKFGRETRYRQVIERSGRLAAQLQQSRDTGSTSEVGPSLSGRSSGAAPSAGGVEFKVLEEML